LGDGAVDRGVASLCCNPGINFPVVLALPAISAELRQLVIRAGIAAPSTKLLNCRPREGRAGDCCSVAIAAPSTIKYLHKPWLLHIPCLSPAIISYRWQQVRTIRCVSSNQPSNLPSRDHSDDGEKIGFFFLPCSLPPPPPLWCAR